LNKHTKLADKRPITHPALWLPPLIWMALIFIVSGTPSEEIPKIGSWDSLIKKGGHMAAYALLAILWFRALESSMSARKAFWLALGLAFLYAISDEYHQTFVPGRNGTGQDVLIDTVGAWMGLWGWRRAGRGDKNA
jgi:VanZ family protein